jgi:glycosyltransferase involved in cell wall biosynthesis
MKKVGFILLQLNANWLGGLNYYRSLIHAINAQQPLVYRPVVMVPRADGAKAREIFEDVEVIATDLVRPLSIGHLVRKLIEKITGRDALLEFYLKKRGIKVISHGPTLGPDSQFPNLSWVPDFQHIHLPHFFEADEISRRNARLFRTVKEASGFIVSSEAARDDFLRLYPEVAPKLHVLRFVPKMDRFELLGISKLVEIYGVRDRYIFLPNQFWAHKNHKIVIEALESLKLSGYSIQIVCTGSTVDDRNPDYFSQLRSRIESANLGSEIKILGVVPYLHMQSLMFHAHAVINPSLFEGWSTTVEEAKLMGKRLLLSDIPVHREQAGMLGTFFNPLDGVDCAKKIIYSWEMNSVTDRASTDEVYKQAVSSFGQRFTEILDIYVRP